MAQLIHTGDGASEKIKKDGVVEQEIIRITKDIDHEKLEKKLLYAEELLNITTSSALDVGIGLEIQDDEKLVQSTIGGKVYRINKETGVVELVDDEEEEVEGEGPDDDETQPLPQMDEFDMNLEHELHVAHSHKNTIDLMDNTTTIFVNKCTTFTSKVDVITREDFERRMRQERKRAKKYVKKKGAKPLLLSYRLVFK